ncbi:MAG: NAD(P)-binding domain-containing protein [Armatimonadetes bacterium]|nr:NAD(P)-binding domain-containing protein [Armatimonadota bacterium]
MHIVLLTPMEPEQDRRLRAVVPAGVKVSRDGEGPPVTAVIGGPPPDYVEPLHQLEWVQFRCDSLERFADTLRLLSRRKVVVTRTRGSYNATVPDHALMLLLALARDLPGLLQQRAARSWEQEPLKPVVLSGATVGIIGMGSIGGAVATRCLALGMRVLGVDPAPDDVPDGVESVVSGALLGDVLEQCDFVVVAVPHTPGTVRLVGAKALAALKPGARLINIGRGIAVDTEALVEALDGGRLAAAALDVVEPSLLPPAHPLWTHPRAILTGHSAQLGSDGPAAQFEIILDNVRRYVNRQELRCRVDPGEWA